MATGSVKAAADGPLFNPEPRLFTIEEVLEQIDSYLKYMRSLKSYNDEELNNIFRGLLHIFYGWSEEKSRIAHKLVDDLFPKELKAVTDYTISLKEDIFKEENVNILIQYYFSVSLVWNFTDASAKFSKAIVVVGLIPHYLLNLSQKPVVHSKFKGAIAHLRRGALGIFHNIISNCPEYKQYFRENHVNEVVEPYLSDTNEENKSVAIMIMSSLINEDEADKLEDNGSIKFIIDLIDQALNDAAHKATGLHKATTTRGSFSALELLNDLARIAVNDKNKHRIVDENALPLLVTAMKSANAEEQESATKTIWTLCFDQACKQKVKEEPNCVETLESLSRSSNKKVQKAAKGALWEVRGAEMHRQPSSVDEEEKHIFISYDWGHAKVVRQICDKLKSDGHKVWIDIDRMGGSTLEAMAAAVENAKLVLICLSERYKLSPSCRSEAKYTWKRQRPIVPLMMQRKYEPDGWLGIIIGDEFYVDFAKYEFDTAYKMLLEQMDPYLSDTAETKDDVDGNIVPRVAPQVSAVPPTALKLTAAPTPAQVTAAPTPAQLTPDANESNGLQAAKWTKAQVQEWIASCQLRDVLNATLIGLLESMDGELLASLCWVKNKVPDYFMNHLSQQYHADILQMLHLIKALNKLP